MTSADERGSFTAFTAVVAIGLVMVAGMVLDGGTIVNTHATVRADAARAARAGAQQVDLAALRATGTIRLDPHAARTAALDHLRRAGATGTVTVSGADVTVTAERIARMRILPIPDRAVRATETATATDGAPP